MHTILVIAEVILENVSLHDGVLKPFPDGYRKGALWLQLVEMVGLPLGRQLP
ncbi:MULTISPECIES: hypothetical protein [Pseudomonas]|uniref:hypothetical protein n=1 Tax=Pseudomonadaceae TaxID=135621 RepID=UPI000A4B19B1|nr:MULTISPECIES: hypothetical protein [Pseudomonas]